MKKRAKPVTVWVARDNSFYDGEENRIFLFSVMKPHCSIHGIDCIRWIGNTDNCGVRVHDREGKKLIRPGECKEYRLVEVRK